MNAVLRIQRFPLIVAITFLFPIVVSGLTVEDIQAQIQSLLGQVEILKTQDDSGTVNNTATSTLALPAGLPCLSLTRPLSLGSRGEDVQKLQKFLIAAKLLATGNATRYFGPLSEAAVRQFQIIHNVVSSGDAKTTGFGLVGPKTRAAILKNCTLYAEKQTLGTCPKPPPTPLQSECAGSWEKGRDASNCLTGYQCIDSALSNETATSTKPKVAGITITEPVLGGIVTGGNTLNIKWRSESSTRASVSLSLIDIEGRKIGTIADNLSSSGKYAWSVPSGGSGCSGGGSAFDCIMKFTRCEGGSSICSLSPGTYAILATLSNVASTTSAPFQIAGTAVTDLLRAIVGAPIVPIIPVSTATSVGLGAQAGMCVHEGISFPVGATLSVPCVAGHCFSTGTGFINGACSTGGKWCIPYTSYCAQILTLIDVNAYEGGGAAPIASGDTSACPKEGWRTYFSCAGGSCQNGYHICRGGVWIWDPNQKVDL